MAQRNHNRNRIRKKLPPDPERLNSKRAIWAGAALATFQTLTNDDDDNALKDLLADLMHYCDRNGEDFDVALDAARFHYKAETGQ